MILEEAAWKSHAKNGTVVYDIKLVDDTGRATWGVHARLTPTRKTRRGRGGTVTKIYCKGGAKYIFLIRLSIYI